MAYQRSLFGSVLFVVLLTSATPLAQTLVRLTLEDGRVVNSQQLLQRQGRIRDVREGPDGHVYVAFESRTGAATRIVRLEPVPR